MDGILLYLLAALCFVWQAPRPAAVEMAEDRPPLARWRKIAVLVAVALGAGAATIFWRDLSSPLALALWVASLGFLVISILPTFHSSILLFLILLLAAFMRLYRFNSIPFGTWYDEADGGLHALSVLQLSLIHI